MLEFLKNKFNQKKLSEVSKAGDKPSEEASKENRESQIINAAMKVLDSLISVENDPMAATVNLLYFCKGATAKDENKDWEAFMADFDKEIETVKEKVGRNIPPLLRLQLLLICKMGYQWAQENPKN